MSFQVHFVLYLQREALKRCRVLCPLLWWIHFFPSVCLYWTLVLYLHREYTNLFCFFPNFVLVVFYVQNKLFLCLCYMFVSVCMHVHVSTWHTETRDSHPMPHFVYGFFGFLCRKLYAQWTISPVLRHQLKQLFFYTII